MDKVIKIFRQIQSTNSKNEKQNIIAANAENELFKKCLIFLFDNNVVTGINKKKLSKRFDWVIKGFSPFRHLGWEGCMEYLKEHNTGTDIDIYWTQEFIKFAPENDKEFYEHMVTKTLRLGCDSKTVNKAIPGLIPVWEVQLGSGYEKLKLKNNEWFSLSQKLNGNRCSFYKGKLLSRQGKEFHGFDHIISDLNCLGVDRFYDGELIRKNTDGISDGENFRIGTGIINSDLEIKDEIKFVIFDTFPESEFDKGESKDTYKKRQESLESIKQIIAEKALHNIEVVNMIYQGIDQSKIMELLDYAVTNDWEGLMLNKDSKYKCKRTSDLIKIKRFYTMDLEVINVLEGDGRLKGTLGALVVKYKDNTVNVGSGFDDKTRQDLWLNKDKLIGRIVEVKYKEITKDKKTGLASLQFPIFIQLREIGKQISYD